MRVLLSLILILNINSVYSLSLYQIGNSLTNDSYPERHFTEFANLNGKTISAGWHIRASMALEFIFNNPNDVTLVGPSGNWSNALINHQWDFVTMQPFPGTNSKLSNDVNTILSWIHLSRSNLSNNGQFFIYSAWPSIHPNKSYSEVWTEGISGGLDQNTVLNRAYFNELFTTLNSMTDASLGIIPIGEVFYRIEQLIISGEITELSSAYDLYRDNLHANDLGKSVIAWTLYSTLFKESAVGLELTDWYSNYNDGPVQLTPELSLKLQKAVDDVIITPVPPSLFLLTSSLILLFGTKKHFLPAKNIDTA